MSRAKKIPIPCKILSLLSSTSNSIPVVLSSQCNMLVSNKEQHRNTLVLVKSYLGKVKVLELFELMHLVLRNQLTCQFETCSCIVSKGNASKLSHGKPCRHGVWRRFQINLSDFARAKYGLLWTIVSRECPFECVCRQKYAGMQSVWYPWNMCRIRTPSRNPSTTYLRR